MKADLEGAVKASEELMHSVKHTEFKSMTVVWTSVEHPASLVKEGLCALVKDIVTRLVRQVAGQTKGKV